MVALTEKLNLMALIYRLPFVVFPHPLTQISFVLNKNLQGFQNLGGLEFCFWFNSPPQYTSEGITSTS